MGSGCWLPDHPAGSCRSDLAGRPKRRMTAVPATSCWSDLTRAPPKLRSRHIAGSRLPFRTSVAGEIDRNTFVFPPVRLRPTMYGRSAPLHFAARRYARPPLRRPSAFRSLPHRYPAPLAKPILLEQKRYASPRLCQARYERSYRSQPSAVPRRRDRLGDSLDSGDPAHHFANYFHRVMGRGLLTPTARAISSVDRAVCVASVLTSPATTAKPRPASPARAASIVAFSASRLVRLAMSPIKSGDRADLAHRCG